MQTRLLRLAAVVAICAGTAAWYPGTAGAASRSAAACPTDKGLTITCSVDYGTDNGLTLTLDAYQPTASLNTALPAVILIHGGEWSSGNDEGDLEPIAEQMASDGLVTFSINYTEDVAGPSYPQAVDDAQTAVNFLHSDPSQAGEWNINPAEIGALGTSSGAYLAAMLATCTAQGSLCTAPQIQAAALWSAPLNLTSLGCTTSMKCEEAGKYTEAFLGCYQQQCPSTYTAASPSTYVTAGAAPMLLWNSDNEAIPVNQLSGMVQELHADCANYRFTVLPGNQHAETYSNIALSTTISFLQQQLGANPPKLGCSTTPPWTDAATAFDPAQSEAVAFGGCCNTSGTLENTTRVLTSGTWVTEHPAKSPPARIGASMAWDPASKQLILFGGETVTGDYNTALNDTWSWNGTTWTKLAPAQSPPVRSEAALAYDESTGDLVLFGGESPLTSTTNSMALNDTWTWNGTTWTSVSTGTNTPAARYGAVMATDPASGHPILFGGDNATSSCDVGCLALLNDTWEWTGSGWQSETPGTVPPAREFAAMAATEGASSGSLVLFGGLNGTTAKVNGQEVNTESLEGDTWTWQNGNWVLQQPSVSPPALYGTTMPDSPVAGDLAVIAGGFTGADTLSSATYSWTGSTWVKNS